MAVVGTIGAGLVQPTWFNDRGGPFNDYTDWYNRPGRWYNRLKVAGTIEVAIAGSTGGNFDLFRPSQAAWPPSQWRLAAFRGASHILEGTDMAITTRE